MATRPHDSMMMLLKSGQASIQWASQMGKHVFVVANDAAPQSPHIFPVNRHHLSYLTGEGFISGAVAPQSNHEAGQLAFAS